MKFLLFGCWPREEGREKEKEKQRQVGRKKRKYIAFEIISSNSLLGNFRYVFALFIQWTRMCRCTELYFRLCIAIIGTWECLKRMFVQTSIKCNRVSYVIYVFTWEWSEKLLLTAWALFLTANVHHVYNINSHLYYHDFNICDTGDSDEQIVYKNTKRVPKWISRYSAHLISTAYVITIVQKRQRRHFWNSMAKCNASLLTLYILLYHPQAPKEWESKREHAPLYNLKGQPEFIFFWKMSAATKRE